MSTALEDIKRENPELDVNLEKFLADNFSESQLAEIEKTIAYNPEDRSITWKDGKDSVKVAYDKTGQLKKFRAVNEDNGDVHKFNYTNNGSTLKAEQKSVEYGDGVRTKEKTKLQIKKDQQNFKHSVSEIRRQKGSWEHNKTALEIQQTTSDGITQTHIEDKSSHLEVNANPLYTFQTEKTRDETRMIDGNIEKTKHKQTNLNVGILGVQKEKEYANKDFSRHKSSAGKSSVEVGLFSGLSVSSSVQKSSPTKDVDRSFSAKINPIFGEIGFENKSAKTVKDAKGGLTDSFQLGMHIKVISLTPSVSVHGGEGTAVRDTEGRIVTSTQNNHSCSVNTDILSGNASLKLKTQYESTLENGETYTANRSWQASIATGGVLGLNHGISTGKETHSVTKDKDGHILKEEKKSTNFYGKTTKLGHKKQRIDDDGTVRTESSTAHVIGGQRIFEWENKKTEKDKSLSSQTEQTPLLSTIEDISQTPSYQHAEIKHTIDEDGQSHQFTEIDGKKHGADITFDNNGQITQVDLYDQGVKLELSENDKVDLLRASDENGRTSSVLLNGKPFGTIVSQDKNGNIQAGFYGTDGLIKPNENASISLTMTDNQPQNASSRQQTIEQMKTDSENAYAPMEMIEKPIISQQKDEKTHDANVLQPDKDSRSAQVLPSLLALQKLQKSGR